MRKRYRDKSSVNLDGYLSESPNVDNNLNIIPSNNITMKGVNFPIIVSPVKGGKVIGSSILYPNEERIFEGADYVVEQKFQEGGAYKEFFESLPLNLQGTVDYDMRYLWENQGRPKNFEESLKREEPLFDLIDGEYHAPSVEPETLRFLKSKDHPTLDKEIEWYNSKDGAEFKSRYDLDTSGEYYIYKEKLKKGGEMKIDTSLKTIINKIDSKRYQLGGVRDKYFKQPINTGFVQGFGYLSNMLPVTDLQPNNLPPNNTESYVGEDELSLNQNNFRPQQNTITKGEMSEQIPMSNLDFYIPDIKDPNTKDTTNNNFTNYFEEEEEEESDEYYNPYGSHSIESALATLGSSVEDRNVLGALGSIGKIGFGGIRNFKIGQAQARDKKRVQKDYIDRQSKAFRNYDSAKNLQEGGSRRPLNEIIKFK